MKRFQTFTLLTLAVVFMLSLFTPALCAEETKAQAPDKLLILFTTDNPEVMNKMAVPYAMFGLKQEWWKEVRFLIWGPSAKMIAEHPEAPDYLKSMKEAGIELLACKWCAEQYSVDQKLAEMGVTVEYMGQPLTDMLKSDWKVLTF